MKYLKLKSNICETKGREMRPAGCVWMRRYLGKETHCTEQEVPSRNPLLCMLTQNINLENLYNTENVYYHIRGGIKYLK